MPLSRADIPGCIPGAHSSSHLIVPSSYSARSQSRYSPHEAKSRTRRDANAHVVKGLHSLTAMRNRRPSRSMRTSMRIAASGVPKYRSQLSVSPWGRARAQDFGFYAKTEEAAEHSHAHCDCRIVPGFDGVTTVKGYDPDGMYERYNDCLAALGGRDGIASDWYAMPEDERKALVRRHGNKEGKAYTAYLNNRVASEIELRDPSWYAGGEHKGITFTDDAVRRDKVKRWRVDPGERRTAEKLAALGYKTEFWEDEVHLKSENAQGKTTVSRADLSTGIEIKTVYTSKSENTFKSHMKSVANKSGVRFAVFDVSENKSVTDSQAEAWIRKYMKRYGISEVRMLGHDGSLQTIKK